mgnify:FL=1
MIVKDWTLYYEGQEPVACQAPCTLYSVLYESGRIPDPFYGLNDQRLTALADKDCAFEAQVEADEALLSRQYVELTFQGLDTICRISLNGVTLDRVKNMHRAYTYDVKELLRPGKNTLRLEFASPTRYFAERHAKHYLYTNDGDTIPGAAHLRKALYQSGWDWGPALPDMGIYRPVTLEGYDVDRIGDVAVRQHHREDGSVEVEVSVAGKRGADTVCYASMDGKRVELTGGTGRIVVENPRLWWVRGYGEQNLYDLDIEMTAGGRVIDRCRKEIGLRTLTVSTAKDPDGGGSEFCFVNNGVKIFSMGANYIPQDNLLSRVTPERLDEMMVQCLDGNFNTLRVWGGGYYPDDYFFHLCDRNGILVWLDFMVACANVYMTEEFERECAAEAEGVLKRLHHHASLGLFCGNNEMEEMIANQGKGESLLVRNDYVRLYEHVLPELCERYAPQTFYWPSSPSSGGGFDEPGNFARGDTHYWEVWHGGVPFTTYRKKSFRFCSEYGFESFPSMKTIRTFCEEKDMNCFSRVMEDHQKCKGGNGKILRYLADNYLYPSSFEDLVYLSQLLQADAIKYGVEHFRRQRGYCMGSIYWQFNDCWPVASWSSVDSLGRYKALHYAAKKFYAPVAMGLFLENGRLAVNISNETMADFRGHIQLSLCRSDLTVLDQVRAEAALEALTAKDVFSYKVPESDPYETYLYVDLYDGAGNFLMRQTELLVPAKHFSWLPPHLDFQFTDAEGGVEIAVTSDVFTKGVAIDFDTFDCVLSDNFFDLTDGQPYRVTARTDRSAAQLRDHLLYKTVNGIR